jgi:integrase
MTVLSGLDAAGRPRSPATMPGYHAGRPPRNKGIHYPADPPTIDEIVAVMRHTADGRHGWRLRAIVVVLRRAGLRVQEALALAEHDLDAPPVAAGPPRQGWLTRRSSPRCRHHDRVLITHQRCPAVHGTHHPRAPPHRTCQQRPPPRTPSGTRHTARAHALPLAAAKRSSRPGLELSAANDEPRPSRCVGPCSGRRSLCRGER